MSYVVRALNQYAAEGAVGTTSLTVVTLIPA